MEKKVFTEIFDSAALSYIIDNFSNYRDKFENPDEMGGTRTSLINYISNSQNGEIEVRYRQIGGIGRHYAVAGLSMQGMTKFIRQTISKGLYKDIDMVNAHPVILLHLARKYGFECTYLTKYVERREEVIAKIIDKYEIGRDEVKRLYLIITNADNSLTRVQPKGNHMKHYKSEMIALQNSFAKKFQNEFTMHKKLCKIKGRVDNFKGSFMNTFLCNMENNILEEMFDYLGSPENSVLCFDGIMIPYDMDLNLRDIERHIKSRTGIDMKLVEKPFTEAIDIAPVDVQKWNVKDFNDYTKLCVGPDGPTKMKSSVVKDFVRKNIFYCNNGGSGHYVVSQHDYNLVFKQEIVRYYPIAAGKLMDTINVQCNIINENYDKINAKDCEGLSPYMLKKVKPEILRTINKYESNNLAEFVTNMRKNGEIRTYKKLDFYPYLEEKDNACPHNILNMFGGFVNHGKNSTVRFEETRIYKHIRDEICNGNIEEFDDLNNHIADIVQDAGEIKGVAHVFYSVQGTGKDLFGKFMSLLLGHSLVVVEDNANRFFNNSFNSKYVNKLLLIFQEASERGATFNMADRLKSIITKPEGDVERKGIDAVEINNFARVWLFTNNEGAVRVEPGDRRYTLHHINPRYANNKTYFAPICDELTQEEVIVAAFKYYAEYAVDTIKARCNLMTTYGSSQQLYSLPAGLKFIKRYIEENYEDLAKNGKWRVDRADINRLFKEDGGNVNQLKTQLDRLGLHPKRMRINGSSAVGYELDTEEIQGLFRTYLRNDEFTFNFMESDDVDSDEDDNGDSMYENLS